MVSKLTLNNIKLTILNCRWSFIGVFALGALQFTAGVLLTVFTMGAGAVIGRALISEGINDIITAVKDCLINRNFNWKDYAIQKAISIVVTVLTCGKHTYLN